MKRDGRSISTVESGGRGEAGSVLQQALDEASGIQAGEGQGPQRLAEQSKGGVHSRNWGPSPQQ